MKNKFDLTTQNKLIISALIISTVLIVIIAFWAVNKIKYELDESYRSFGQLLTKTLAVQNYEITQKTIYDTISAVVLESLILTTYSSFESIR